MISRKLPPKKERFNQDSVEYFSGIRIRNCLPLLDNSIPARQGRRRPRRCPGSSSCPPRQHETPDQEEEVFSRG